MWTSVSGPALEKPVSACDRGGNHRAGANYRKGSRAPCVGHHTNVDSCADRVYSRTIFLRLVRRCVVHTPVRIVFTSSLAVQPPWPAGRAWESQSRVQLPSDRWTEYSTARFATTKSRAKWSCKLLGRIAVLYPCSSVRRVLVCLSPGPVARLKTRRARDDAIHTFRVFRPIHTRADTAPWRWKLFFFWKLKLYPFIHM